MRSPRLSFLGFVLLAPLAACGADPQGKVHHTPEGDSGAEPDDNFGDDGTVRITSPANGAVVTPTFVVSFTAGADIVAVTLSTTTGIALASLEDVDGSGDITVSLDEGNDTLSLYGIDASGTIRSHHNVRVVVSEEGGTYVAITSPTDGASVPNPVYFTLAGSDDIDNIELYADDFLLGSVEPGELLSYSFEGTGFVRQIEARGYQGADVVATDQLKITVEPATAPLASEFNALVLEQIDRFPTDGSYAYYWPPDGDWYGNPDDVWYRGDLFEQGDPENRSYCVGLTLQLLLHGYQSVEGVDAALNDIAFADLDEFRTVWFVEELYGAGSVDALEAYGIGERVTDWEDIEPGDVLQFWRQSGSGHNNFFIDWVYDDGGEIIGLTYWSTQGSTDGIGYNTEYFGSTGSKIDPNYFFAGRIYMPEDWVR